MQDLYIFGRDYQYKQGDLARAMREHGFGLGDKLTLEQWKTIFSNPFPKTKNPTGTTKAYFAALASGLGQWDALQEQAAQSGYNRPVLPSWSGGLPGSPVPAQPAGPGQGMLLDAMQQTLNPSPFQMPTNVPFMGKSPLPAFNPTQFIRDTTITPAPLAPPPVIAPVKIDTDINPLLRDQLAGKYAAKPMMETTEAYNKAVERMKSELAEAGLSESGATIAAVAENLTMPYLRQVQALWSESAGRAVDQLLGINTRNAELEFNRRAANAGFSSEHAKLAMETLNKVALAQADINSRQGVALGQLALGARAQDIGYISTAEQKNLDAYLQLLGVSFQDAMDIRNRVENATRYLLQDSQFHTAFGPQWYGMVQNAANSIMEALLRQQGFVTSAFNAYQSEYSKSKSGGGFSIGLV